MKNKTTVRVVSFLSAGIIVACGFVIKANQKNESYKTALKNGYSRSFDDFGAAINNITETLNKAKYVTTAEQISGMAAKLLAEAELSKNALSQLPVQAELSSLNRFLSQVGNYAMAVSKELIRSGSIGKEENEQIELLSQTANEISSIISDTNITYNSAEYWAEEIDRKVDKAIEATGITNAFTGLEDELSDYPTLIYDGPYSDHILEKEPTMITGAGEIGEKEALEKAAMAAECEKSELGFDGFVLGHIPSFRFVSQKGTVTVSKNGGHTVFMRKDREVTSTLLEIDQARQKAKRYLERMNMSGFIETYYYCNEGICVVNFAYIDGETVCYTDLIKVGVAMDNGEIMLYEASGYLSNHTERAFETPAYTADQAQVILSKNLTLKGTALALIPTDSAKEARCYEFTCEAADGQEILIYINTQTLEEEEVLILLKSDGGTLVK